MNEYDASRKNEMDQILEFIYKLSENKLLRYKDVYSVLRFYGLKESDRPKDSLGREVFDGVHNREYFSRWINDFTGKPDIVPFVDPDYPNHCQFVNPKANGNRFIKLYVPIDADHLFTGVEKLFKFMSDNGIIHESYVHEKMSTNNVIIRLSIYDEENAQKIIDFINSDQYLKEGLNKPNPFVPTIGGVGYMKEHGNSYNGDISWYILEYVNRCRLDHLESINAEGFRAFLQDCKNKGLRFGPNSDAFDLETIDIFEKAYNGNVKELNPEEPPLTDDQKRAVFMEALDATYEKYGYEQIEDALARLLAYGDFSGITNGGSHKYRENLQRILTVPEISRIVDNINYTHTYTTFDNIEDKVNAFCIEVFADRHPALLDEICRVTLENYGPDQVKTALDVFIQLGGIGCFSRYKDGDRSVDYRSKMKMFGQTEIISVIYDCLANKGIDPETVQYTDITKVYAEALDRERLIRY